ncbi:MAG: XTP/dITP diphosphatase [Deltaproteobacteria bacterium]|nr:XTP/dITP diphosphatase [Deltaproteobacteria bacterium]
MRLVIATRNRGKFEEISQSLSGIHLDLIPLWEFSDIPQVAEDQPTFRGNAIKKAREICRQTGLPALADDSGLVVDALGGRPGVFSARFAGENASDEENLKKLLKELEKVPLEKRSARFTCVLALKFPDGREFIVEEACQGRIALEPRGEGGFGYDPVFLLPGLGKTMAEISPSEKNQISHRGRALRKMREDYLTCASLGWETS